jgi:biopolymer transport protein ExbD
VRVSLRFADDYTSAIEHWTACSRRLSELDVVRWAFSENDSKRSTLNAQRSTSNSEKTMRRYSQRQSLSSLSEINITPLLDLAFVLLIIFMITTPLLESSMNLVIPSSGTKNPPIKTSHVQTVSIDRTDAIRFNNQVMDLETLTTQLVQLKQTNPDIAIVIRPDRDLPVQKLIGVMDALQRAGITKVGIATKAEPN